ncbi:unnamed protein product, partial [Didymodactylos carnosus]
WSSHGGSLKYIIPCQTQLCSRKPIDDIIIEQYQNMSKIVKDCLQDNDIFTSDPRSRHAFLQLERIIHDLYSKQLPRNFLRRAHSEYKVVRSIQRLLRQRPDIVIRRTDKTENLHAVQTLLHYLMTENVITKKQRNRLLPNLNKLELGHYHGLPKPHKPGTPLRPIIASINASATLVSKFLNDLLAPIFLQVARKTTFINGIDVVRQLEKYVSDGYYESTTKFITADVTDLYTMIPRQGALEALARFCLQHSKQGKIGTFTIDHIMKMARLILDTNAFVYNKKYYRQIRGGAMGSALTQVLANIYMFEWEQNLIKHQDERNEIYGRYIDDIFMTTNETIHEIKEELEEAQNRDVNIKINYKIDISVDFLDVCITNENSQLKTKIYHKPAAESYTLPYRSTHPRHIHRNIPYGAFLRAIRICSNINDFNTERCHIDVSLLLNGYPPNYITK